MHRRLAVACALVVVLACAPHARAQSVRDTTITVTRVITGLSVPTTMTFIAPDDILVCEKETGRVRRVIGGVLQGAPVLDLPVNFALERGLLGITTHPQFATNKFVYLYATISSTGGDTSQNGSARGNFVLRFTWNGTALVSGTVIRRLPVMSGPNHNGGIVLFGPDAKLYTVIGDLNHRGKLQNEANGPNPDFTGSIFRMNDDGTAPPDNPFAATPGMELIYAYGVRNSFGLAFDPLTNVLWDTENGEFSYDEVNRVVPGFNSGWIDLMGPDARDPQGLGDLWVAPGSAYSDPEFSWQSTVAPTAILFLAGGAYGASYENAVFVGDNNNGNISRFDLDAARAAFVFTDPSLFDLVADSQSEVNLITWGQGFGVVTDLKFDDGGRVHVVSLSTGSIYRLDPGAAAAERRAVAHVTATETRVAWSGAAERVRVFSMDGRCVWSSPASGLREIAWSGTGVPRGVYLVRVENGSQVVGTTRVVLTR